MTCQECEIKFGMGEDAGEHLVSCEECRSLARELRLNSLALREMRVRPAMHWQWALAAAAAIVMAVFLSVPRVQKLPPVRVAIAPSLAAHGAAPHSQQHKRVTRHRSQTVEPLRVKMFTSDPDVVIYWIVDKKEGYE